MYQHCTEQINKLLIYKKCCIKKLVVKVYSYYKLKNFDCFTFLRVQERSS